MTLSSPNQDPLIDDYQRARLGEQGMRLNTRHYAQEWLVDHVCRAKAREKQEAWATRLTLAVVVITVIAALIAAAPGM